MADEDVGSLSYERALAQLDTLISKLEKGDVDLDEAIACYERGTLLARRCAALLDRTEQKVTQLVVGGGGQLSERPLQGAAPPAEVSPPVRARSIEPDRQRSLPIDPDEIPF